MGKVTYIITLTLSLQIYGSGFKEILPLEGKNFQNNSKKNSNTLQENKIETVIEEKREKIVEKKFEDKTTNEKVSEYVKNSKELENVINQNSAPMITEEELAKIIENAKNSPLPDSYVENRRKENFNKIQNSTPSSAFIIDLKDTLKKYNFSDKSDQLYGGQVTSKELVNDRILNNLEFGLGIAYKKREYYEREYEKKETYLWTHTPVYATGKYKLSTTESSSKYLKVNLGYAIGEYQDSQDYDEVRTQNGLYYGFGGGVEYEDIVLDLIYQVNKDAYNKNNSNEDSSRVTFSVDYKLD